MTSSKVSLVSIILILVPIHVPQIASQESETDLYCIEGVKCEETCNSPYLFMEVDPVRFRSKLCVAGNACIALSFNGTEVRRCQMQEFEDCDRTISKAIKSGTECYMCYHSNCDALDEAVVTEPQETVTEMYGGGTARVPGMLSTFGALTWIYFVF